MKNKILFSLMSIFLIVILFETIYIINKNNEKIICEPKKCDTTNNDKIEKETNKLASAEYIYEGRIKEYNLIYKYYLTTEKVDLENNTYTYNLVLTFSSDYANLAYYNVNTLYSDDESAMENIDNYIYEYTVEDITSINDNTIVLGIVNDYSKGYEENIRKQVVVFYKNSDYEGYNEVIYTGPTFPPVFRANDKNHKLYENDFYVDGNKIHHFKFNKDYYCENGYGADCLYETIIEINGKDYKEYKGEKVAGTGAGLE